MENHHRELARRLFVVATELIENAHETAVVGQSPKLTIPLCLDVARHLRGVADALGALAVTAETVARSAGRHGKTKTSPVRRRRQNPR